MIKILIFLLFPISLMSQQDLKIDLTFGTYIDDHAERTFHSRERIWKLFDKKLEYSIDAHDVRYVDTLELNDDEINKITQFIKNKGLIKPVIKNLESKHINKHQYSETISGSIQVNGKNAQINIKANRFDLIEGNKDCKPLQDLEQMFYKIVENHN